jgi:predicted amidohydrolase YtcJ
MPQQSATQPRHQNAIVTGGRIYTMDAKRPQAEAVVIRDGRIAYIGDRVGARQQAGSKTETIDLKGRTAFPGFIESHSHPMLVGRWLGQREIDCQGFSSIGDIIAALRQKAAEASPGAWILGFNYDPAQLVDQRHPTRVDLDRVSCDHPIVLRDFTMHNIVVNSETLRIAGITADTVTPPGGTIVRDDTGEPTGLFLESAAELVQKHVPAYTVDDLCGHLRAAANWYPSSGITSVVEAGLGIAAGMDEIAAIEAVMARGGLPIRYGAAIYYPVWKALIDTGGQRLKWPADPEWMRPFAVKLWQDGALAFQSALSVPAKRQSKPGTHYLYHSQSDLNEMVADAHDAGWQLWIHANGDLTIQSVLDAYDRAVSLTPRDGHRHRIEHCQFANNAQLDRMAALGVVPSFFPAHLYYWGDDHLENFGPEWAVRLCPMAAALQRELVVGMHNDSPFTPMSPMIQIYAAVTRQSLTGRVLGETNGITVDQAVRALTIGNAYLAFEENIKGSLQMGKLGDLTVLAADPYQVEVEEIKDIPVAMTIIAGRIVYQA